MHTESTPHTESSLQWGLIGTMSAAYLRNLGALAVGGALEGRGSAQSKFEGHCRLLDRSPSMSVRIYQITACPGQARDGEMV